MNTDLLDILKPNIFKGAKDSRGFPQWFVLWTVHCRPCPHSQAWGALSEKIKTEDLIFLAGELKAT